MRFGSDVPTMNRLTKRIAVGLLALLVAAVVAVYLISLRASPLINELLREWATGEVASQSDSVYALRVGSLHFNWPRRRVTLDSAFVVTDSARNAQRTWPKTTVQGVLRNCVISGINLPRLVFGRGLESAQIGCAEVHWDSDAPPDSASVARFTQARTRAAPRVKPPPADSERTIEAPHGAMLTFQRDLHLPSRVPTIRIGRIVFPKVAIGIVARKPSGDRKRFDLARAQLRITGVVIDPGEPQYRARPLFADGVVLRADSTEFHPDTAQMVRVGALEIDLTDSTLTVQDFEQGPRISDTDFQRLSPYRRERIRFGAARLAIRGIDQGGYSRAGAIVARAIELDSLRFEILSDKRKPRRPGPRVPSRTPQSWFSSLENRVAVDSIHATNATIIYEEFKTGHDRPGRLTIDDVDLLALHMRHEPDRRGATDTMSLEIRGKLMSQGTLRLAITTPLDAERMTMWVRGSLGAMDAQALNPLIEHVTPARIKNGRIDGVIFEYTVRNDVARGVVVPRYTNLAADLTGTGAGGILGRRGPLGGLIRAGAEAAQGLKVRQNNPDEPDRAPRVGQVNYTFSGESLPSWFWNVLKQGLLSVAMK
jgi:hypothetical protein